MGDLTSLDQQAFGTLVESHRRELHVHCYRLLGSLQDAEDMVQETFLRAWRRRETYAGRATVRAWLYKIATNACLDTLEKYPKRVIPLTYQTASPVDEPIPPALNDPIWLDPYPDEWLITSDLTPEGQLAARENIRLAFITALHLLPPRQRAVLILRDVLDWQANEVAALLEMTVSAVKSALYRARSTLAAYRPLQEASLLDDTLQLQLDDYIRAWETADVNALLALLKVDATFSMPPTPSWYQGREVIGGLVSKTIFSGDAVGRWRLLPTRANGQPAFGLYRHNEGQYHAYGIQVITVRDSQISDIITFRTPALVPLFNLPMEQA